MKGVNIFFIVFTCLGISCNKDSVVGSTTEDVYVAGFDNGKVVYWKNGVETVLAQTVGYDGMANDIAVSGNDVYVVGRVDVTPMLWKNGQSIPLTDGSFNGEARAVTIENGDVYITGIKHGLNGNYWKNGVDNFLANGEPGANALVVSGNDIYVAGKVGDSAVYWKNGVKTTLAKSGGGAISIAVAGNDVYVGGQDVNGAAYWKNGVRTGLSISSNTSAVMAIAVSGTDVYAVGFDGNDTVLWKNGVKSILIQGYYNGYAMSIFISGSDVFISGTIGPIPHPVPVYWKNGVIKEMESLPGGLSDSRTANSIVVVRR